MNHAKFDHLECHCHLKFRIEGAQKTERARQRSPCKNSDKYIQTFWFEEVPISAAALGFAQVAAEAGQSGFQLPVLSRSVSDPIRVLRD